MKLIVNCTVLMATIFFVSCNNGKDKIVIDQSLIDSKSLNTKPTVTLPDTVLQKVVMQQPALVPNTAGLPGATVLPGATNAVNLNTQSKNPALNISPATVQALPASNNGKMNPAHGQPGHRCDIAVGAPLNSKPASTVATTPAINATANINTQPAAQAAASGMNPAHGQPGHRCDISVGAPLNSKPAASVVPTITPVNLTAAKADSTKN